MNAPTKRVVDSARRSPTPWFSVGIIAAMLIGGLLLDSTDGERVHLRGWSSAVLPEACWSKRWLGWNCPFCGATRSVIHLTRGRWSESWQKQPAGILTILTAVVASVVAWTGYFRGPQSRRFTGQVTQGLWISLLVFVVFRHALLIALSRETSANPAGAHAGASPIR
jgi:hypothetical protein